MKGSVLPSQRLINWTWGCGGLWLREEPGDSGRGTAQQSSGDNRAHPGPSRPQRLSPCAITVKSKNKGPALSVLGFVCPGSRPPQPTQRPGVALDPVRVSARSRGQPVLRMPPTDLSPFCLGGNWSPCSPLRARARLRQEPACPHRVGGVASPAGRSQQPAGSEHSAGEVLLSL